MIDKATVNNKFCNCIKYWYRLYHSTIFGHKNRSSTCFSWVSFRSTIKMKNTHHLNNQISARCQDSVSTHAWNYDGRHFHCPLKVHLDFAEPYKHAAQINQRLNLNYLVLIYSHYHSSPQTAVFLSSMEQSNITKNVCINSWYCVPQFYTFHQLCSFVVIHLPHIDY